MYLRWMAAGLAIGLGVSSVEAADITLPSFPDLQIRSGYDWSGPYVGAHLAHGWGLSPNSYLYGTWLPDGDIAYQGFAGGIHAGYQRQFGNVVVGAEADLTGGSIRGDDAQTAGFVNEIEISGLGTLRGRLGFAQDNFLVFATGGLAVADFYKRDLTNGASGRHFAPGWTLGGGVEVALTDNIRLRAEYQYIRLDTVETGLAGNFGGYLHRADAPALNVLRVGASYAF